MNLLLHTGLTEEEKGKHLNDVMLMRLAHHLKAENLYPLTAELLENVKFLEDVKADFADLKQTDHACLVMVEWRKRVRNERGDTSAGRMAKILHDIKIDHHLVCLVIFFYTYSILHIVVSAWCFKILLLKGYKINVVFTANIHCS